MIAAQTWLPVLGVPVESRALKGLDSLLSIAQMPAGVAVGTLAIGVAGVFLNRKNIIVLLMCIELMLLAVNFNFVAFSRFRGDISGQIFVFFILTVAAAEAAIGLAILVVLFRERSSIDVEDLDTLQG